MSAPLRRSRRIAVAAAVALGRQPPPAQHENGHIGPIDKSNDVRTDWRVSGAFYAGCMIATVVIIVVFMQTPIFTHWTVLLQNNAVPLFGLVVAIGLGEFAVKIAAPLADKKKKMQVLVFVFGCLCYALYHGICPTSSDFPLDDLVVSIQVNTTTSFYGLGETRSVHSTPSLHGIYAMPEREFKHHIPWNCFNAELAIGHSGGRHTLPHAVDISEHGVSVNSHGIKLVGMVIQVPLRMRCNYPHLYAGYTLTRSFLYSQIISTDKNVVEGMRFTIRANHGPHSHSHMVVLELAHSPSED